jgi:hypothetical protein
VLCRESEIDSPDSARVEYGDGDPGDVIVVPVAVEKPPHMGG